MFANRRWVLKVKCKGRVAIVVGIPHVTLTLTKSGGTGLASGVGVDGRGLMFLLWIGRVPEVGRDTAVDAGSGSSHFKLDGKKKKIRGGRRWGG